jgi:hypothetical protein
VHVKRLQQVHEIMRKLAEAEKQVDEADDQNAERVFETEREML